jgi:protoheme ferro-lyase
MTEFQNKGYVLLKTFSTPKSVKVVSRYLENALRRYPENNQGGGEGDSSKISYYADPLIEMILKDKLAHVEEVTGFKLFPSYSFTRVYQKGEELKAHMLTAQDARFLDLPYRHCR